MSLVYLTRHGRTFWNLLDGTTYVQSWSDDENAQLTLEGQLSSCRKGEILAREPYDIAYIASSPLGRAKETSEWIRRMMTDPPASYNQLKDMCDTQAPARLEEVIPVADEARVNALPIKTYQGLRDRSFGDWDKKSLETLADLFPKEYKRWGEASREGDWSFRPGHRDIKLPGPESKNDVYNRSETTLDEIFGDDENSLIVTHNAMSKIVMSYARHHFGDGSLDHAFAGDIQNDDIFRIRTDPCTIERYSYENSGWEKIYQPNHS